MTRHTHSPTLIEQTKLNTNEVTDIYPKLPGPTVPLSHCMREMKPKQNPGVKTPGNNWVVASVSLLGGALLATTKAFQHWAAFRSTARGSGGSGGSASAREVGTGALDWAEWCRPEPLVAQRRESESPGVQGGGKSTRRAEWLELRCCRETGAVALCLAGSKARPWKQLPFAWAAEENEPPFESPLN